MLAEASKDEDAAEAANTASENDEQLSKDYEEQAHAEEVQVGPEEKKAIKDGESVLFRNPFESAERAEKKAEGREQTAEKEEKDAEREEALEEKAARLVVKETSKTLEDLRKADTAEEDGLDKEAVTWRREAEKELAKAKAEEKVAEEDEKIAESQERQERSKENQAEEAEQKSEGAEEKADNDAPWLHQPHPDRLWRMPEIFRSSGSTTALCACAAGLALLGLAVAVKRARHMQSDFAAIPSAETFSDEESLSGME